MKHLTIGMDIDNVLYPWSTVYTRWVERAKGLRPGSLDDHALSWTWYKDQWGMETAEFLEHYRTGVEAKHIFNVGDPTIGSVSAMRRLSNAGHRIHYVTDRAVAGVTEAQAMHYTVTWLARHGFPYGRVAITADKPSVPTDVFLDDGLHNIAALVDAGHACPVIWDRPHNHRTMDSEHYRAGARRVHDWHAFQRLVDAEAKHHFSIAA